MKKYILVTVFTLVSILSINAQDYKWWIGGRTTLWAGDKENVVVIAPEIGYHLNQKFTVAASLGFHSYNYDNDDQYMREDINGFVLNPYLRYNVFKKGILFGYVDGGVEFGLGDIEGVQAGLKPGIAVAITDRFCVAMQFGFVGYNDGKGLGARSKGFGLDLSGYQSGLAFFYSF
ncbi:MAG: hypothetical protein LBV72_17185 [Tannerella sp.]|jgi:hypothetical protein|nr:hypothetical protein [Tannerella sp.]